MDDTATRPAWHAPHIVDPADDIAISPKAARLVLTSRHPSRERTDPDHDAALARERQARWRERDITSRRCGLVDWSEDVLTMLVETGYLDEGYGGDDPKAVAKAIGEMLEEAAQAKAWRKRW